MLLAVQGDMNITLQAGALLANLIVLQVADTVPSAFVMVYNIYTK